jgi:outer membrane protein TolC
MDALKYYEFYKIAQEQESDTAASLAARKQRLAVGVDTKIDLALIEADFAQAQSHSITAKASFMSAKARLESYLGVEVLTLRMPLDTVSMPKNMVEAVQSAIANNPEFEAVKYSASFAKSNIDVARANVLPRVDLSYGINDYSKYKSTIQPKRTYVTQMQLSIPLMDVGAWSELRSRKRLAAAAGNQMQAVMDEVRAVATAAWVNFEASKSQLKSHVDAYNAMKLAYAGWCAKEKVGLISIFDMIQIRDRYFRRYKDLMQARADYYKSIYALKAVVGECTAKGLGLNVQLYDPLKNYNAIKWQLIGAF